MTRKQAMLTLAQILTRSPTPTHDVIRLATWRYDSTPAKVAEDARNAEMVREVVR